MAEATTSLQETGGDTRYRAWRKKTHDILELGRSSALSLAVNYALIVLIVLNALAFAAETMPHLGEEYAEAFLLFDAASVLIFTIEYGLRLWSCVENQMFRRENPWRARFRFARRPLLLVDLAAILPFYIAFLVSVDLRVLRVLRLFRFLKLARYSTAIQALGRVIVNERMALLGALLVMMTLLLFSATGMYFLEREAQPDKFGSIPEAAWWALATLTTIGYGDVVPLTPLGKLFGGVVMVFGLGMFAMPIAIIATGFSEEAHRREFVVTWAMVSGVPIFSHLEAPVVAEIMSLLHTRSFEEGAVIMHKGDPGDAMYFVASGSVVVHTKQREITLGEGDFFGEMALLHHRPRLNTVTAAEKTRLLALQKDDFEKLCRRQPEVRQQIREVADARLGTAASAVKKRRPRVKRASANTRKS